jgi:hypothetical protein
VEGFTYCSVPKFKMVFVNKSVENTYQDATGGSSLALLSSGDVLCKIKETSRAAVAIYDHLQLGKKWNLPGKHVHNAAIAPKCDNCGNPNHLSPKCPKPCNEEKCKKAWEARAKARDSEGGRGGRGHGGQGGRGGGAGCGSGSGGQRAPWDSTAKNNNSGVMMINGAWKMLCNKGLGGMSLTKQSTMMSISNQLPLSRCHHTIHIGFFQENLTLLLPLLLEY